MTEKSCRTCKNLNVIVSQTSDYWCSKKDLYLGFEGFIDDCNEWEQDVETLREKEERVW